MDLFTKIDIPAIDWQIDYNSHIAFFGSCFADNISAQFAARKFKVLVNPFGTVYNPLSIAMQIKAIANKQVFGGPEVFQDMRPDRAGNNAPWHCWDAHGSLSAATREDCVAKLNEASAALRSSISPTLAHDAGELMDKISDGKYPSLGISNKLEITYNLAGMTHPAETLSTGTLDTAYVCLRLALVKMLFPKGVPAFFDDTFARVDDKRAARIAAALADTDRQTVIFTCRGREGAYAGKLGGKFLQRRGGYAGISQASSADG